MFVLKLSGILNIFCSGFNFQTDAENNYLNPDFCCKVKDEKNNRNKLNNIKISK